MTVFPFVHIFDILSLFAIELEELKIGILGKGLNVWPKVKFEYKQEHLMRVPMLGCGILDKR